jgi:hypothetical protein
MKRPLTRRDWWLGVLVLTLALLIHAAWPRYEWRHVGGPAFVRIDRWTGTVIIGSTRGPDGRWMARELPLAITDASHDR